MLLSIYMSAPERLAQRLGQFLLGSRTDRGQFPIEHRSIIFSICISIHPFVCASLLLRGLAQATQRKAQTALRPTQADSGLLEASFGHLKAGSDYLEAGSGRYKDR